MKLPGSEESNISADLNETSTSSGQPILNPQSILKNIRLNNLNKLIFSHLTINSVRNKFDSIVNIVNWNNNVFFLISEIKTDSSFAVVQFHIEGYTIPYRLDRYINGGGFFLYIREDIPSSLINFDVTIEDVSVET